MVFLYYFWHPYFLGVGPPGLVYCYYSSYSSIFHPFFILFSKFFILAAKNLISKSPFVLLCVHFYSILFLFHGDKIFSYCSENIKYGFEAFVLLVVSVSSKQFFTVLGIFHVKGFLQYLVVIFKAEALKTPGVGWDLFSVSSP